MKKIISALIFTLLCASTNLSQTVMPTPTPKPSSNEDVVKISTALIQVDVTVTDKSGKVVKDLKPEDFEIYENGEKQNITNFSFISAGSQTDEIIAAKPDKNEKPAVPVPPTQIKPEQVRRTIALVVDDLTLSFESTHFVRRALRNFVEKQMQEGDLVAIIRTGSGIGALQQFTSDKRQLFAAIEKVQWNPRGAGKISAFDPISVAAGDLDEPEDGRDVHVEADLETFRASVFATGTLGAVNYVVNGMNDLPGRKSIMLLSDGFQLFERNGSGMIDSSRVLRSLENLIDTANRASVVIYTMDARGLQTLGLTAADDTGSRTAGGRVVTTDKIESAILDRRTEFFDSQDGLVYLAKETGGFPIINSNDLAGGIRKILDDQSYYLIGYEPDAETFDPKTRRFNKIEIKVKRKGTDVRYRSGFFGVTDEQIKKPLANQTAEQQILTALSSPFAVNDISLRLNTILKSDAKKAALLSAFVYVNAKDLRFSDEPDGRKKVIFDVLAISFGSDGAPVDQLSKTYTVILPDEKYQKIVKEGLVYYFTFPIKKNGAYQMRIALRDHASGKVGSASQFIEVPNLKKNRLTLSGIALENLTLAQWNKEAKQTTAEAAKNLIETNPLLDTSLREFKRGTILRYGFEIYNAAQTAGQPPQLQTQTRLFRDGKIIFEGRQIPVSLAGQTDLQIIKSFGAINLGTEMEIGDYILQIITTDNSAKEKNKVAAQFVQFEIVP